MAIPATKNFELEKHRFFSRAFSRTVVWVGFRDRFLREFCKRLASSY